MYVVSTSPIYDPKSFSDFHGSTVHQTKIKGCETTHLSWVVVSIFFIFTPIWERFPILTNIFQTGWNHQLVFPLHPNTIWGGIWTPFNISFMLGFLGVPNIDPHQVLYVFEDFGCPRFGTPPPQTFTKRLAWGISFVIGELRGFALPNGVCVRYRGCVETKKPWGLEDRQGKTEVQRWMS